MWWEELSALILDTLQNLKSAIMAHRTAEEELEDQVLTLETPEMKAKYDECKEVEKQLQAVEKKLGKLISFGLVNNFI